MCNEPDRSSNADTEECLEANDPQRPMNYEYARAAKPRRSLILRIGPAAIISLLLFFLLGPEIEHSIRHRLDRKLASRAIGAQRLQTIQAAILSYDRREGQYPPHMALLVRETLMSTSSFVFSESGIEPAQTDEPDDIDAHTAFVFAHGVTIRTPGDMILGFSMPAHSRQQGLLVLAASSSVRFQRDADRAMAQIQRTNDFLAERRTPR